MKLHWMPLSVAEYRADTAHLGATEHGIYLLLIMHYWQTGGLPDDDRQLARIACCSVKTWNAHKRTIFAFFKPGWKHGRVDRELAKAKEISGKRRDAALQMHSKSSASAEQVHTHLHLPSPSQKQHKTSIGGGMKKTGWTPPRHGATSTKNGRVYVEQTSEEWGVYAADYKSVHGHDPIPNEHGGKWFKTLGEAA